MLCLNKLNVFVSMSLKMNMFWPLDLSSAGHSQNNVNAILGNYYWTTGTRGIEKSWMTDGYESTRMSKAVAYQQPKYLYVNVCVCACVRACVRASECLRERRNQLIHDFILPQPQTPLSENFLRNDYDTLAVCMSTSAWLVGQQSHSL